MNDIVAKIYELIAESGISKTELAKRIGVSKDVIQYWKRENAYPAVPVIKRICEVFDISVEQFFCGMGRTDKISEEDKFLNSWRLLTDNEKRLISDAIVVFNEAKAAHND